MTFRATSRLFLLSLVAFTGISPAQSTNAPNANPGAELQMVVMLSRHGVRSPLGSPDQFNKYSAAPWPAWDVPPGYLTARGYQLMKIFGGWDRAKFSGEGLLSPAGCADSGHVTIRADIDQRTVESAKALAEGMFPGCSVPVHSISNGGSSSPGAMPGVPNDGSASMGSSSQSDPLFRPLVAGGAHVDGALAVAAIDGRTGGDPNHLTEALHPQLAALDHVLAGCGHEPANSKRVSIFDIPSSLKPGSGDPPVAATGPLVTASTLAENLLLEYTQGMSEAEVGWGCVDGATLRYLMQLDTARWDYGFRTPVIARTYASNLLDHILRTMEQSVTGNSVPGAIGNPTDRLVLLVGHDTNIVAVAGALGINWVFDGREDDTPPGGALVFELWRSRADQKPFVRVEYMAQTLEQMRNATALTPADPPADAPVFVPGCSRQDLSCTWDGFSAALRQAIDPADVSAQP